MKPKSTLWLLAAVCLFAFLAALAPIPYAHAQEPKAARMVRNDGVRLAVKSFARNVSSPIQPINPTTSNLQVPAKHLPAIQPNGTEGNDYGTESVIGTDERVQVQDTTAYPSSAVAYLEIQFPWGEGSCSGWMIGPHTVATAAHCVYLSGMGGWATAITVYPGRNSTLAPFGSYSATNWYVKPKWIKKEKPRLDFAAINIGTDIAESVGTFGFAYTADNGVLQNRHLTVRGYPADKPDATMWTMDGNIEQVAPRRFFYSIDTAAGQSGSPAYGKWGSDCDPCGFGIHAYGVGGNSSLNGATRITAGVFNFLNSVIAQ